MKTRIFALLAGFLLLQTGAQAQRLKIATVNMERLFNEYHKTTEVQRDINIERARIQKDNNLRLKDIRDIDDSLQKIREQLKDEEIGEKKKQDLIQEANDLSQDGIHKERERSEFLERRNRALSEKMSKQMRSILVKIQRTVSERAKAGNYDYIFDQSGNSNQGIPFVLHARDTTDLTGSLLEEINKDAPKDPKEGE
ncbi:OmpH family outer membrane protein [Akkermansiaceae bacterium]|jgi:outer membrane protein|nr:OmpH family outer membrane protein [Akkermansiaceae bacterium]